MILATSPLCLNNTDISTYPSLLLGLIAQKGFFFCCEGGGRLIGTKRCKCIIHLIQTIKLGRRYSEDNVNSNAGTKYFVKILNWYRKEKNIILKKLFLSWVNRA